ncbi:DUF6959 family protein [Streptomyces sp. NPDC014773]|uniref:DUF6959 family protein n=1 Tax=Streptomyces sp. NPDC014773 TaxID=3364908 RepID=UPI0036FB70E8
MERLEAEPFTDGGNDAVVRLPGRGFPGLLIQGDSLGALRPDVAALVEVTGAAVRRSSTGGRFTAVVAWLRDVSSRKARL